MEMREDKKNDDVRAGPGLHNTRRDFLKICGVAAGSSAAGLFLPGAAGAAGFARIIEKSCFAGCR